MGYQVPVSSIPILMDPPFVASIFCLAAGIGSRFLRIMRVSCEGAEPLEIGVISCAIGAGILQYLFFILGVTGNANPTAVWIGLGFLLVIFFSDIVAVASKPIKYVAALRQNRLELWQCIALLSIVVILLPQFFQTFCPPTDPDGLMYHLTGPKRWLQMGSMGYLPTMVMTQWPMGVEMLYSLNLAVWSDTAAKLVHFTMGVLCLAALWRIGRRLVPGAYAVAGVLIFLVTSRFEFGSAYIDLGISLQVFCSVLAWVLWQKTRQNKWLNVSALCGGLSASFKLTGIFVGVAITLLVFIEMRRELQEENWLRRVILPMVLLSIIPVFPWLCRSCAITGNPVYPLLATRIPTRDWNPATAVAFDTFFKYFNWGSTHTSWGIEIRKVIRLVIIGIVAATGGCVFVAWRNSIGRNIFALAAILTTISIWMTGPYPRYLIPILPLFITVAVIYISERVHESFIGRCTIVAVTALYALLTLVQSRQNLFYDFKTAFGIVSRETYLDHNRSDISLWRYINANVSSKDHVLITGEQSYYCNPSSYILFTYQGRLRLDTWEHFEKDVRRDKISYLVSSANNNLAPNAWEKYSVSKNRLEFCKRLVLQYGTPIFRVKSDMLYRIDLQNLNRTAKSNRL